MQTWRVLASASALAFSLEAGAVGGLADVSIYDRTEGRSLPIYWHQGAAYVVGKPGNEYQIALRNRFPDDLLAVVSVDGVNVITGETASPEQSGYVLGSGRSLDIAGWRKNLAQTAAFYFTALSDSYAAHTGRPADAGVIGVALFRRKQESHSIGEIARGERRADSEASPRAAERLGTGHGRRETSYARFVDFQRASTAAQETITIYYDSYRNLLARGIIRESVPVATHPRPFPGFVPDPQTWLPVQPMGG